MSTYKRSIVFSILSIPLGLLSERNFRRLPRLTPQESTESLPSLTIIIPARNEMDNLHVLLPSLLDMQYPAEMEILVVDDNSIDRTVQVAKSYGVRVLQLDHEPPDGWLGKPFACHQGALNAGGDWFLFTDADTLHSPNGIPASISYAQENRLDCLSLFLKHKSTGWLDQLAVDAAFAGLFTNWHASKHLLNGQYILIQRKAYFESGGFESVRNESLEDVAFGSLLKKNGYKLEILNGEQIASVSMYHSNMKMFQGLSRLGSGMLGWQNIWAILTAFHVTTLVSPLFILPGVFWGRIKWVWLPVTWGAAGLSMLSWSRRSGSGWLAILAPVGALFVLLSAIIGLVNRLFGRGISWKDRLV